MDLMHKNPKVMPPYQVSIGQGMKYSPEFGKKHFETKKRHFLVPKKTEFICISRFSAWSKKKDSDFYCALEIVDDRNGSLYEDPDNDFHGTHPYFGISEIKSTTIQVDILASDKRSLAYTGQRKQPRIPDHFREIPKPTSEKFKEFYNQWKEKIFN